MTLNPHETDNVADAILMSYWHNRYFCTRKQRIILFPHAYNIIRPKPTENLITTDDNSFRMYYRTAYYIYPVIFDWLIPLHRLLYMS